MCAQPSQPITPAAAGEILDVSGMTIRRWCAAHADHLSAGANPAAANTPRLLTARDVEVLKHVKDLRSQGLTEVSINERLTGITFGEVDPPLQQAAETHQEPAVAFLAPALLDALTQRLDAAQAAAERAQRDKLWVFIVGFAVGIAAMAALLLIMLGLAALAG